MCQIHTLHESYSVAKKQLVQQHFEPTVIDRKFQKLMERSEKAVVLKRYGRHTRDIVSDLRSGGNFPSANTPIADPRSFQSCKGGVSPSESITKSERSTKLTQWHMHMYSVDRLRGEKKLALAWHCWYMAWLGVSACMPFDVS